LRNYNLYLSRFFVSFTKNHYLFKGIMASYNDIKSASDTSLREKEIEAIRINKINKDKFKIAFNLSNAPVVAELSKIGNTFLGGKVFVKTGL
jgi:hypothetical protein